MALLYKESLSGHISPFPSLYHISIDGAVRSARYPATLSAYDLDILLSDGLKDTVYWSSKHGGKPSNGSEWPGGGRLSFRQ